MVRAMCGSPIRFTQDPPRLRSVAELNNSGAAISHAGGNTSPATMGGPNDVAIESSGNVWAANAYVPVTFFANTVPTSWSLWVRRCLW